MKQIFLVIIFLITTFSQAISQTVGLILLGTCTFYKVDNLNKILWKYINPGKASGIVSQGTVPSQNMLFRCVFYPTDYSAFAGHTLSTGSIIENSNIVSAGCNLSLRTTEIERTVRLQIYHYNFRHLRRNKINYNNGVEIWAGNINDSQIIKISAFQDGSYVVSNKKLVIEK